MRYVILIISFALLFGWGCSTPQTPEEMDDYILEKIKETDRVDELELPILNRFIFEDEAGELYYGWTNEERSIIYIPHSSIGNQPGFNRLDCENNSVHIKIYERKGDDIELDREQRINHPDRVEDVGLECKTILDAAWPETLDGREDDQGDNLPSGS